MPVINHTLGAAPGMVIYKDASSASNWTVHNKEHHMINCQISKAVNGFVMRIDTATGATSTYVMKELNEAGDTLSVALATLRLEDKMEGGVNITQPGVVVSAEEAARQLMLKRAMTNNSLLSNPPMYVGGSK